MRVAAPVVVLMLMAGRAAADEPARFAERTPLPHKPAEHTQQRAGYPAAVAPWAVPGLGRRDTGVCVNGTFGWDTTGWRPGHLLVTTRRPHAAGYRTDGPRVPDVVALRPFRRAVLEKKHDTAERTDGH